MTRTLTQLSTIVLAVLALATAPAFAADYYVDPVNGDDNNSGTSSANAWSSPSRGASLRTNGAAASGATTLNARDTSGFMPSGTLNITGLGNVAYDSKTSSSFNIPGGLSSAVSDNTVVHDANILGGTGFASGDTIKLGGGVFTNQHIRMKASGVHYEGSAFNGQTIFNIVNYTNPPIGPMGAVWHDGEYGVNTAVGNTISGVNIKADNNLGGSLAPVDLNNVDNFTLRDSQVISTGSASSSSGTNAIRANYSAGLVIDNVILLSKFGAGLRSDVGQPTSLINSIIRGSYSAITTGGSSTTNADNITIHDGTGHTGTLSAITEHSGGRVTLTDSLVINHPSAGASPALNEEGAGTITETGDYNVFVSMDTIYSGSWTPGANDVDLSGTEAADFGFISIDPMTDAYGFVTNDDYLRALRASPANDSGISGDYLGARFEVLPEPTSVMLLGIAGAMSMTRRRRA